MEEVDLSLVTTKELLDALMGRFDHGIVCGMMVTNETNRVVVRKYVGDPMTACGLSQWAIRLVMAEAEDGAGDLTLDDI